jgi:hypothetical protein
LNEISSSYIFRLKSLRSSSKKDYLAIYEDVEQHASIEPEESSRKRLRLRLLKCKSITSCEKGCLIKTNEINNGSKNVQSFWIDVD